MTPDTPDQTLLRDYVERRSEAAFGLLVRRHLGLVYATCRRETGNRELAEDAALAVFVTLARKAPTLHREMGLAGWLFQTARLTARNAWRDERRRERRAQEVAAMAQHAQEGREADDAQWRAIEPLLNDALSRLNPADREAILLRFFEGLALADVGRRLGLPENTARMRVTRALEKMRRHLAQAGVAVVGASLAALLTDHAAQAAPASCLAAASALTLTTMPVAAGQLVPHFSQGVLKIMSIKAVSTAVAVALVGSVVAGSITFAQRHRRLSVTPMVAANQAQPASQLIQPEDSSLSAIVRRVEASHKISRRDYDTVYYGLRTRKFSAQDASTGLAVFLSVRQSLTKAQKRQMQHLCIAALSHPYPNDDGDVMPLFITLLGLIGDQNAIPPVVPELRAPKDTTRIAAQGALKDLGYSKTPPLKDLLY